MNSKTAKSINKAPVKSDMKSSPYSKPVSSKPTLSKPVVAEKKVINSPTNANVQMQMQLPMQMNMQTQNYIGAPLQIMSSIIPISSGKYDDDEFIDEQVKAVTSDKMSVKQDKIVINPDEAFQISLKTKHSTLQLNSASSTVEPVLFTLKALEAKGEAKVPLDLVCVLDTSGSMGGEKIILLRETLKYLVDLLGENDRMSIVQFSSSARRILPLKKVSDANKPEILQAINSLNAGGGTSITAGMTQAFRVLNERKYKNPVSSIFLLSDGLDGAATMGVKGQIAQFSKLDNYTIHSFGYGSDHDPNLMGTIAKYKDGNFYFVEKLETVDECFVDAIGGLISVVGQDVTITIQPVKSEIFPNLEFKKAFGGADLWKTVDGTYSTGISQLPSGKSKNYILELTIPKTSKSVTDQQREVVLAKAIVTVRIPNSMEVWKKECELTVSLMNEEEELQLQVADKDVLNNYYRVRSAEIMMEARGLAENGDYEGGRKLLQNFKEELSKSAVKEEAMVVGLLEDIEITIQEMQPRVYEAVGKHRLVQQMASHMEEKSNPFNKNSANLYSNSVQQVMVSKAKAKKM
mmetsp:Transcript_67640/g.78535  ORF Transcript_67640/g.78535 Transcript_67640/m.78535 type:complete len:576 (+) Transcript_67640:1-1728(+)